MDLSTTSQRVLLHTILSYIFLPNSVFLNVLVFILVRKATKLGSTRQVINAFSAVCILLSIAHGISIAHWEHLPHTVAFFPTGPLATVEYLTPIAFQLQQVAYISIICLVGYMYIHRYLTMITLPVSVNPAVFVSELVGTLPDFEIQHQSLPNPSEQKQLRWKIVYAVIGAAIVQWECICLFIMKPDDKLRKKIQDAFGSEYAINFMQLHFLAVDLAEPLDPWQIFNAVGVILGASVLISLIHWCGFRIHSLIGSSISSERAKRIQRRVLRLLIFQAIHPLLIFELPSFVNFFQLMLNVQFPDTVNLYLVFCIAVFPLTNPLLTLLLSREISAPLRALLQWEGDLSRSGAPLHTTLPSAVSISPRMPI